MAQQNPEPQPDPQPNDAEDAFWTKLDTHLDGWLDRKSQEAEAKRAKDDSTGTSRTGAKRPTLPGIIADIVFGPPKE